METIKFSRIPDSEFTYHYEIKEGPDKSLKLRRNTHTSVGLRGQEIRKR